LRDLPSKYAKKKEALPFPPYIKQSTVTDLTGHPPASDMRELHV